MHPHHSRGVLRYLLMGLLIAALIVLFPITVRSTTQSLVLALILL